MWYHVNDGYVCDCCGATIPIYYNEIWSRIDGRRVGIASYGPEFLCKYCLVDKIRNYFDRAPVLFADDVFKRNGVRIDVPCTIYGTPTSGKIKTIDTIMKYENPLAVELGLDIRFCAEWWNGFNFSYRAIEEMLMNEHAYYSTSHFIRKNGKLCMTDRNGISIDVSDHKIW